MRASTFFAAAAALATTVSAGMVPTFAKRYNITQAWGEWEVTNFTASSHPSSSSIDFLIFWDKGNSGPVHCNANGYSVGGEGNWYACESNNTPSGNFHFSLNQDWNNLSLSQDMYQIGSIVHLNGSAPFEIKWGFSTAGSEATADPFYVPVLSESHTLPNGTTTAPEFSSRK
ncbi:hypothetical protein BFW01_g7806 [Lasiodiplodia theobromae]|uniref:AA1-like domain-containing protein n=2 Tax=Lasiodiplodia TaxID=66739 RepID=A0A5N5DIG0_9PEZI|nr:uncharacterized protein LTHEOB_3393 [Lasiodiplodia theobromae]KAB2576802.1 hypothetical protein DBV05_g4634 [Lasiodiplodia theobromae]KAF4534585.1 hypothetical protein LTHEOB_3393 [Lasiodiplodia theobromae]KAF9636910.1 hypothetical protein BFW01_g7806 [Lasiodiplodia theobromae]KAK0650373.1 hypothetical protein DIS24_g6867 [Lasiodiplodia hormozganensis]